MDFQLKLKISVSLCALVLFSCTATISTHLHDLDIYTQDIDVTIETEATVDSVEIYVEELIRRNQLTDAHEWSTVGLKLAEKIGYRKGEFNLSLLKGSQFLNRNMIDSTIYYSERALELAETEREQKQALNILGNGHAKAGRSIIAIDLYEQVLALADSLDDEQYTVGVLINLATAHSGQGEHNEGLKFYFDALERSEELGNVEFIALITNNLGDKFTEIGNYEQAEYYLKRSREISQQEGILSNLVRVHLNLGNLFKNTGRFEEAEESYEKALQMNIESGNLQGQVQVVYNMGMMHLAKKDYVKSRFFLQQSLAQSREIDLQMGIFYNVNGLGELEKELGNLSQSINRYREAVNIAEMLENNSMKLLAFTNLYKAYKQAGNQSQALNWLEKVDELNEEIRSSDRDRLTAQYESKFKLRRSEQEKQLIQLQQEQQQAQLDQQRRVITLSFLGIILLLIAGAILIRSNKKRKTANDKLLKSNKQLKELNETVQHQKEELERLNNIKTKLFAIIAHDLRGPLGSLQSLLYLLREHDLSEEETNKLTTNLEKNMLENSSMMDNLLGWAQTQMNGITVNKRSFDLKLCLESVLDQFRLQAENKSIELSVEISKNSHIYADYDLMKLVLRNLIANAIKFSHSDSVINIGAEKIDKYTYKISVKDNGIGIPIENQSKIFTAEHFTSPGTEREKGSGLGLNLCKEYVEKHGGSIWFETSDDGTTFFFTIPADQEKNELVSA